MMEKLAFALVMASRKLRHYFQAYVITSTKEGDEQIGSHRTANPMGHRT